MKDLIAFANENHLCFLATTENDQPHVRALDFWFADETGFYFQTGVVKEFYQQLLNNPKTEVCFHKKGEMAGTTLRITGKVEFLVDRALKEKCLKDRPYLGRFNFTPDSPGLILFRIAHGQGQFWTMETNLKPKEIIKF